MMCKPGGVCRRRPLGGYVAVVVGVCVALSSACGRQSPVVGTWKGNVRPAANAGLFGTAAALVGSPEAMLTLNTEGKGYAKFALAPEQPITWREEDGGKVILSAPPAPDGRAPQGGDLVGTLSADGKTLAVDLGPMKAELTKQPEVR